MDFLLKTGKLFYLVCALHLKIDHNSYEKYVGVSIS